MIIAQLTDLHIRAGGAPAYGHVDTRAFLDRAVAHLNALVPRPDCVVVSGDLGDLGTSEEYAIVRDALDRLHMPYHPIPGNHDGEAFWDVFADCMPGALRDCGYRVAYPPLEVILLDTRVPGEAYGAIGRSRAAWLREELLLAQAPALLVMHHPPIRTGIGHMDRIGLDGIDLLHAVIAEVPAPLTILSGHIHRTIIGNLGSVPVIVSPGPAHAVTLDLRADAPSTFHMEPPGIMLHRYVDGALTSHVSLIGDWAGPYPFFNADNSLVGS